MIRAGLLTFALLALPVTATAHCGSMQGSFSVTCEKGVKIYRHNAPSSVPAGPSKAQTHLEAAKLRQETAQRRIQAEQRAQAEQAELRRKEIENESYRNRIRQDNARRRVRRFRSAYISGSGYYGYYGGYTLARPVRVRRAN